MPENIVNQSRKELREAVKTLKTEIAKKEKSNTEHLFFYLSPSGGDWFMAGGNSALMFMNLYAERLGYTGQIRKDSDSFARFGLGTIKLPRFDEKYAPRLIELGLKPVTPTKPENRQLMRVYKLPREVSMLEITRWHNFEETERARTNQYLEGDFKRPVLFTEMRMEMMHVIDFARKLPEPAREIYGRPAGELAFKLYMGWLEMAKGRSDKAHYLTETLTGVEWLLNWLHFLLDSHDASYKFIANRAEALLKLRDKLQVEVKQSERANK